MHFLTLDQLNNVQIAQYKQAIARAFPRVLSASSVIIRNWPKLEQYFPKQQHFLFSDQGELLGFINSLPFHYAGSLEDLPENGWDWMIVKGITDYENGNHPNYLGGLQVIVLKKHQGRGYSKIILSHAKKVLRNSSLSKLLIPIRPTKKHLFPSMSMEEYLLKQEQNKTYDPWIRTHLSGGAQIVKVCTDSMTIQGDVPFWEKLFDKKINSSGQHVLTGALAPIRIDLENNIGRYVEANIWVKYD